MSENPLQDFIDTVETWQTKRIEAAEHFSSRGLREFCEIMNYHTRRLVSLTGKPSPEFWSAVAELATNAQTLTTKGAKLFADKQDRTNV